MPGANQVQISRYAMPSIEFCMCLLMAASLDDWLRGRRAHRAAAYTGICAALFALITAFAVADAAWLGRFGHDWLHFKPSNAAYLAAALAGAALAVAAITWSLRGPPTRTRQRIVAVVLAADIAVPFMLPTFAGLRHPRLDLSPIEWLRGHAGLARTYVMGRQVIVNYGSYFGVATLNAFSLPLARTWAEYVPRIDVRANDWYSIVVFTNLPSAAATLQANRAAFEQAGVRYVLVPRTDDGVAALHDPAFRPVFEDGQSRIYELPNAAPYFQIIGGACTIAVKNRERLDSDCAAPAHLLRREMFFAGWHARVNDHTAPLTEAQDIFQQIDLPIGHASIRFWYAPPRAGLAWMLFAMGVAGMVWQGRKHFFFEKKKQKTFICYGQHDISPF
jgi:hypothetical protein